MAFQAKFRVLGLSVLALAFAQTALAQSSCVNFGTPTSGGIVNIECNLYYNQGPSSFNLAPLMEETSVSDLAENELGASYFVVINGDPNVISNSDANDAALFADVANWEAVLYFPDAGGGFADSLQVYFPGAFPVGIAATVQTYDETLYGMGGDSAFFADGAPGSEVTLGDATDVMNVYTAPGTVSATPEPSSFILLFSGLSGAGLLARFKRVRPSQA
jgi:hypothetical protein